MSKLLTSSEVVDAIRKSRECSIAEAKALHDEFMFERIELVKEALRKDLRDEFAAAALQGMLAHAVRYHPRPSAPLNWHLAISQEAYEIANAMLVARKS